jgi:hypothetical protein
VKKCTLDAEGESSCPGAFFVENRMFNLWIIRIIIEEGGKSLHDY